MRPTALYSPAIDGLRAIAVLAVIFNHAGFPAMPGGFTGVDVFFAISGFVVSAASASLAKHDFNPFILRFYARRLMRITPALIVCLIATCLMAAFFVPRAWLSQNIQQTGLLATVGLSNFALLGAGTYFSPTSEFNPFTHTWSLGIEEQFYLIFPLLFFLWLRKFRKISVAMLVLLTIASAASASVFISKDATAAFYLLWNRFWELGAGVLLFQFMTMNGHSFESTTPSTKWTRWGAVISLLVLLIGFHFARPHLAPIPANILPVFGTLGLIFFLHGREGDRLDKFLSSRPLRWIGRLSYSLYLWHWPILVLLRWTIGMESPASIALFYVSTVFLSVVSFHFVESPVRLRSGQWSQSRSLITGISLLVVGFISVKGISNLQDRLSLSSVVRYSMDWFPQSLPQEDGATCRVEIATRPLANGDVLDMTPFSCAQSSSTKLFVVGDSHALAYRRMLENFVKNEGKRVVLYNNAGCPFIPLQLPRKGFSGQACNDLKTVIDDVFAQASPDDVLFLPALRIPRLADHWAHLDLGDLRRSLSSEADAARERDIQAAVPFLNLLEKRGIRILFEAPKPVFDFVPYRCSDWFNRTNPICEARIVSTRAEIEMWRAPVLESMRKLARLSANVSIWDPLPELCSGPVCETMKDGRPLFFDGDHISGYANDLLLPSFSKTVSSWKKNR